VHVLAKLPHPWISSIKRLDIGPSSHKNKALRGDFGNRKKDEERIGAMDKEVSLHPLKDWELPTHNVKPLESDLYADASSSKSQTYTWL
jgi:hypothetical protein